MKLTAIVLSACAVLALSACSTAPVSAPAAAVKPTFLAQITQFGDPKVNEAASAYVSSYKQAIEESLQSGKYQRELAFKHLNAESCFDSRVSRLLERSLTPEQKVSLVQPYVAPEKLKAYETLARGHLLRANGLETFSCEIAGLSVDRANVKY
ncbi:hypothetical protein [Hydrogenophaga sp. RWCD_12]|uniref:hypothetical protein n=1 Tax=Hydrogenophaga sp. RWCD_12 TaxID=3391190 RepID=UPI003984DCCA